MAKTYKQPSIVSGMTIVDILSMDETRFNALSASDLRKITGRLVSAGNKRMRTLEKDPNKSPALRQLEESGGKLSTKGKTLNELRHEFMRAKTFLESKTSKASEWKKVQKQILESLKKEGINPSKIDMGTFWKVYNRITTTEGKFTERRLRYKVFSEIDTQIKDGRTVEEIVSDVIKNLSTQYKKAEKENKQKEPKGVSDYFANL